MNSTKCSPSPDYKGFLAVSSLARLEQLSFILSEFSEDEEKIYLEAKGILKNSIKEHLVEAEYQIELMKSYGTKVGRQSGSMLHRLASIGRDFIDHAYYLGQKDAYKGREIYYKGQVDELKQRLKELDNI